jgi:hypothetical protein
MILILKAPLWHAPYSTPIKLSRHNAGGILQAETGHFERDVAHKFFILITTGGVTTWEIRENATIYVIPD